MSVGNQPVARTGGLVGLAPQIEIWNSINQWIICQILECQDSLQKRKAPI